MSCGWIYSVFFFRQKTPYEMLRSLVGSEMCIRDSPRLRATMLAALKNVRPTHLLDTALKREPR